MDKVKLTRLAAKWCKEKGVGETPLNIIYALEELGYLTEAAQQSVQSDGAGTLPEKEDWLNEPICFTCGHSKSRHQTAGGFCKHCTCNEFVEPATQPHS